MSADERLERLLTEVLDARAPSRAPDRLRPETLRALRHISRWPRWLALVKESPMRTPSGLAVGSPTVRVTAIMIATLLLALTVAGAGIAGSRLLAADAAIVVDPAGRGDFTTIGDAITHADDGDTILVRPGTYDEAIVLDKDLTIRGDGDRDEVVLELSAEMPPGGTDNPPELPAAFTLEAADAVLENLTLRGVSSRIVVNGGTPELRELVFDRVGKVYSDNDESAPTGLLIDEGSSALIENNVMVETDIGIRPLSSPTLLANEITVGAIWIDGAGLGAEPIIRENTLERSGKWGIVVWGGARPAIVGNTIVDALNGIEVEDAAPTLRGNTVSGSRSRGISVVNGTDSTIEDNVLNGNTTGILASSSDASLSGNDVTGGSVGISITGGSPTLEGNTVEGAAIYGLVVGSGTTPTLSDNTVCGNEMNLDVAVGVEMPDPTGNEFCEDAPAA